MGSIKLLFLYTDQYPRYTALQMYVHYCKVLTVTLWTVDSWRVPVNLKVELEEATCCVLMANTRASPFGRRANDLKYLVFCPRPPSRRRLPHEQGHRCPLRTPTHRHTTRHDRSTREYGPVGPPLSRQRRRTRALPSSVQEQAMGFGRLSRTRERRGLGKMGEGRWSQAACTRPWWRTQYVARQCADPLHPHNEPEHPR